MTAMKLYIKNGIDREVTIDSSSQVKTLEDLAKLVINSDYKKYLGARINNRVYNLEKELEDGMEIEYLDIRNVDGYRIFTRTITAIFIKACKDLYPDKSVAIEQFLGSGLYTCFEDGSSMNFKDIGKIKEKMQEIIDKDHRITRERYTREEAIEMFRENGNINKVRLLETLTRDHMDIYTLCDYQDTYHGYLAPSTGYITAFDLKYYYPGLLILFPNRETPNEIAKFIEQKKLAKAFDESKRWAEILDLQYVGSLNEKVENGKINDVIRVSEALHNKKIGNIADRICDERDIRTILIAGPSSSGKTTFANRLGVHLRVNGKNPIIISVDDYFVNRVDTPTNPDGTYDFEAVEAIDLKKLNEDLISLLEGNEVELPKYNFLTGERERSGKFVKVGKEDPIIVEGIHGLNPKLTREIPDKNKYKIYISALTQLNIDANNRIATTDTRLIRRMVRDHKYRGNDPIRTFELWGGVRKGEEKHIFPYQEEADIMFDSALVYELSILKKYAVPLLKEITEENYYYSEARKLVKFLDYFKDIEDETAIPSNSILREFIGGADLNVH